MVERYPEAYLLQGTGRAYGIEWQLKKNSGKFMDWLSHTFSRAEKLVDGNFPDSDEKYYVGGIYVPNFTN